MVSISKLITEIKRGGFGKRLKATVCNMVRLKLPALWFFIAAVVIALFLPYAFVLSLALLLFCSAVSENNSLLLGIKNAVTRAKSRTQRQRSCRLYKRTDCLWADHLYTYEPRCSYPLRRD